MKKLYAKKNKFYFKEWANTQLLFLFFCGIFMALGYWAYVSKISVVSVADGEVVPSGQIKTVQHLEGGIIKEILVQEGQRVTRGTKLMILESISNQADVNEIQSRVDLLTIKTIRLKAEIDDEILPQFSNYYSLNYPNETKQALDLFSNRMKRIQSEKLLAKKTISQANENIIQEIQNLKQIEVRFKQTLNTIELLDQQIKISEDLLKEKLTTDYNHLNLLKEKSNLETKQMEDEEAKIGGASAIKVAKTSLADATIRFENVARSFIEESEKDLEDTSREIVQLNEIKKKLLDSLLRTTIIAPVDGIIKDLVYYTEGGVIPPNSSVMNIVPTGKELVIEAKLPTADIGFIKEGQSVTIRLASADAINFGNIDGVVKKISPDATQDDEGQTFYKVEIKTQKTYFEYNGQRYNLTPGVEVSASILTGERTIAEYLLNPLFNIATNAIRER
jgi:adhesin transport system membrane fusion protein